MKAKPTFVLLASTVFLSWSTTCTGAIEIGWVESIQGKAEDVRIQRDKAALPAARFQTLLEGDKILVKKDSQVELRLGEGKKSITITATDSPYRVARVGEVPSSWSKMLGWLRNVALSSVGKGEQRSERHQMAATRNLDDKRPPLSVPMLDNPEYALIAGQRSIHIVWQGGQPPYAIHLSDQQRGATLMEGGGLHSPHAKLPDVNLPPGNYLLRISDAIGSSRLLRIEAVLENALPAQPEAAKDPALSPEARAFYYAAWLTGQQNGKWLLESYQLLMGMSTPEAAFLRDALARGETISAPLQ